MFQHFGENGFPEFFEVNFALAGLRSRLHPFPPVLSKTLEQWNKICKLMISIAKCCSNIFESLEQIEEHWNKFSYPRF